MSKSKKILCKQCGGTVLVFNGDAFSDLWVCYNCGSRDEEIIDENGLYRTIQKKGYGISILKPYGECQGVDFVPENEQEREKYIKEFFEKINSDEFDEDDSVLVVTDIVDGGKGDNLKIIYDGKL